MPNLAGVLKEEIQRLARKELRLQLSGLKKASAQHRREIASLKRELTERDRRLKSLEGRERSRSEGKSVREPETGPRFSPKWLRKHRDKLQLSAADYAALVGVAPLTIYNWEKGKNRPRAKQLEAWAEVRKLGKREAWNRLDAMES